MVALLLFLGDFLYDQFLGVIMNKRYTFMFLVLIAFTTSLTSLDAMESGAQSQKITFAHEFANRYGNRLVEYKDNGTDALVFYTNPNMELVVLKTIGAICGISAGVMMTFLADHPGNIFGPFLATLGMYLGYSAQKTYQQLQDRKNHYITLNKDGLTFFDEGYSQAFGTFKWTDINHIEVASEQVTTYDKYPQFPCVVPHYTCNHGCYDPCHKACNCNCRYNTYYTHYEVPTRTIATTKIIKKLLFIDKFGTTRSTVFDSNNKLPITFDQFHMLANYYLSTYGNIAINNYTAIPGAQ